jgi:hypothetical protein
MKLMCEILIGDCIESMRGMPDNSVDSIVTDPPYGLSFMGKAWDKGVPGVDVWKEALRVLKPGGHLLAFAGTRTQHRMACAIEDAGFEIRDMIAWIYGSGFPKSLDVSKAIDKAAGVKGSVNPSGNPVKRMIPGADQNATGSWVKDNGREYQPGEYVPGTTEGQAWNGWGTALKPALEPITVARKPLCGTVAANVLEHGTGALNVDGCRVEPSGDISGWSKTGSKAGENRSMSGANYERNAKPDNALGRWPANLIHDGSDEVVGLFPESTSGARKAGFSNKDKGYKASSYEMRVQWDKDIPAEKGSAARFFYCAKASKADRGQGNNHPTVKPNDLMRYLVRLVTPPGGTVLDPFAGSGSTGKAALEEGFSVILCEIDEDMRQIITQRTNITPGLGI